MGERGVYMATWFRSPSAGGRAVALAFHPRSSDVHIPVGSRTTRSSGERPASAGVLGYVTTYLTIYLSTGLAPGGPLLRS